MEFVLACPNGQWVTGKRLEQEWVPKLKALGFTFSLVPGAGSTFTRVANQPVLEIESLEKLVEIQQQLGTYLTLQDNHILVIDAS
jgi:hypothetical protein